MAFSATTVSVGVTATQLANPTAASISDPMPVVIFNNDPTATLYIGGVTVTTANGFPILAQTGISFRLLNSDPVYGIVAASTLDARVMKGRQ